ncbi:Cloroperoxidase [Mycena kentingensis (nom. inval.)]|nr:Cloroperoxidase [Mycena kentingensis (nom. inval.)]
MSTFTKYTPTSAPSFGILPVGATSSAFPGMQHQSPRDAHCMYAQFSAGSAPGMGAGHGGQQPQQGTGTGSKRLKNVHYVAKEWRAPTASDSRSPCPGINTLANHDILPRSGRNITHAMLVDIFEKFLHLDEPVLVSLLCLPVPKILTFLSAIGVANASNFFLRADGTFDLHDAAQHGIVEHDASLVHDDTPPGEKFAPVDTNMTKAELLLGLSADGVLMTAKDLGVARYLLERHLSTPLDAIHQMAANGEGPLAMSAFGFTQKDGTKAMKVNDFRNVFKFNRLPDGFKTYPKLITGADMNVTIAQLVARKEELIAFGQL